MAAVRASALAERLHGAAERELIAMHLRAYGAFFGVAPRMTVEDDDTLLTFPVHAGAEYAANIARIDELGAHAGVRAYLARLGFRAGADGYLSTIPSPASFDARRARESTESSGFRGHIYQLQHLAIPKREWLSACVRGHVPFALGTAALYAMLSRRRPFAIRGRRAARYFLWGLQHDVTRHALFTHLVPASVVRSFGERIEHFLRDRRPWVTPAPLLRFYENDLVRSCQAVWRDLPSPDRFAESFLARPSLSRIEAALAERLREAARPSVRWLVIDAKH